MADINAYALGLELQLQTGSALDDLGKIEKKLISLEQKMANVGPSSVTTAAIEKQAQAVGLNSFQWLELDKTIEKAKQTEDLIAKASREVGNTTEFLNMSLAEQAKQYDKINAQHKETHQALKEQSALYDKMTPIQQEVFDEGVKSYKQTGEWLEQHKDVQEQLNKHATALQILKPILDKLGISTKEVSSILEGFNKGLGLGAVAAILLARGLKDVMAMQEAYAKTTFRALGSQIEMIDRTNELRGTLGATREEAVKTFTALAGAGFRASDSISELASANYMFSKSTGVTEEVTAGYQRRLTSMGFSAEEATGSLSKMSAMIRNSGLSAGKASEIIGGLNKTLMRLNFAFGKKQAKETGEMIAKFGAAANAAGGDAGALSNQLGMLATDGFELQKIMGATGVAYDEHASKADNLKRLMKGAAGGFENLGIHADFVSKTMKDMGFEEVVLHSDLLNKKAKELGTTFDGYVDSMSQGADLTADFNAATATFMETLKRILTPLLTIGSQLMSVIGPAIVALLTPLMWLATAAGKVIAFLDKIPGVSLLLKGAVLMWIVPAMWKWITANSILAKGFPGLISKVTNIAGALKTAAPQILSFAKSILTQATAGKLFSKETVGMITQLSGLAKGIMKAGSASAQSVGVYGELAASAAGAGEGLAGLGASASASLAPLAAALGPILAIVAACAAALIVVPKLFEMFDSADKSTRALGAALMVLLAPLVYVYVSLKLLWAIIKGIWEAISDAISEAFQPLIEAWDELWGKGENGVKIMEVLEKAFDVVTAAVKNFAKFVSPAIWALKLFGQTAKGVIAFIKAPWEMTKKIFSGIGNVIMHPLAAVKSAWKWATNAMQGAWDTAVDGMKSAWKSFTGLFDDKKDDVIGAADEIGMALDNMWGTAEEQAIAAGEQMKLTNDRLKGTRELITPSVIQTINAVQTPIKQAEPIISPVITDKTARAKTEEHQEKLLTSNMVISDVLTKMLTKVDNKSNLTQLVDLLKIWLPKIAEEKGGGLSTAANQWI